MDEKEGFWLEEHNGKSFGQGSSKRKVKSKKLEFLGWGSKPLIEFLQSIGKDTDKQISQRDVADIIAKYVKENNLVNPAKKKRIVCDERLHSIFGRKSISRIKVYDLLENHYAENRDIWEDDFFLSSDEENVGQEQKGLSLERKTHQKKKVSVTPKSCFAAIVPDNIKLVYLKRSLVQDLLKDPEMFEAKVVGSFVRLKSDPYNFYPINLFQRNSHHLVLVKGLKRASGNSDINKDILLQVFNFVKDVSISMLSDDNFSQEECEELHQRIKGGSPKRPTVAELEAKAQILHEDITKHWIATELTLLPKLINRANEKGWRRDLTMFEYMEKRDLLQTPAEQSRLLREVPNVIAEEIELESASQDNKHENDNSQPPAAQETSEIPSAPVSNGELPSLLPSTMDSAVQSSLAISKDNSAVQSSLAISKDKAAVQSSLAILKDNTVHWNDDVHDQLLQPRDNSTDENAKLVNATKENGSIDKESIGKAPLTTQVIDLSDDDDDDDEEEDKDLNEVEAHENVSSLMWHYADPQGDIQGPFSLKSLKSWMDADYFPDDFKVWMTGQNRDNAVLLTDILRKMFSI